MRLVLALVLVVILAGTSLALDTATRPVSPVRQWEQADLDRFDPSWLHVKFVEGIEVTLSGRQFQGGHADLDAVNTALSGAVTVRRTFQGDPAYLRALKQRGEQQSGRTGPDLSLWYDVRLPADRASLAATINQLNASPAVEIAHPAPRCEPAVVLSGDAPRAQLADTRVPTPDYTGLQDYLYDTPVGLDAPSAWAQTGGRGLGMRFIDVELWWTWTHEEFSGLRQFYRGGIGDDQYVDHGTAVLGEIIGMENGFGITGFANQTSWGTVGITVDEWPTVPHYFQEAIDNLRAGDVWLIELQMYPPGRDATPMEWLQVNYDVIWTGCWSLDVVCIEAGANGSQDLDTADWNGVFDRDVRDSGAIMVGAGTPVGRVAEYFTNYGSRMDVHAWGSEIVTTGYGDLYNGGSETSFYTAQFGGTSGASPMITGSALCLQGIARANLGSTLTPAALRQLLHDTGIAHLDPSREIGPRPDLGAAAEQLLGTTGVAEPTAGGGLTITSTRSPFDGETEIRFRQARQTDARLTIYDVAGRRVRSIELPAASGARRVQWDGRDGSGNEVGSGVYLYRLEAGAEAVSGRMVKVR